MTYLSLPGARHHWARKILFLLFACVSLLGGAGAFAQSATINSFTATPTTINLGDTVTLQWSVTGSKNLWISADANGDVGAVNNLTSITVKPTVTTRYVLTAWAPAGNVTKAVTVTVVRPKGPAISSFTASPATITAGDATTLSWSVSGATALSISPGVGTVTGSSVSVKPTASTNYVLTATNASGTTSKTIRVHVHPTAAVPVISTFAAAPATITAGGSTTLSWSVSGATLLSISPGVGTVTGNSVSLSPTATTNYVLTASNTAGSVTKTISVTVQPATTPAPVISTFSAAPASITAGGSTTLSWSVTGATLLSISPGVGTVTGSSVSVSPTATTNYVLTASNTTGSVTKTVSVTVQPASTPAPVIGSFTVTPGSINAGGSATLSWSVTGATSLSIAPAPGAVTGTSVTVSPATTTAYTLSATNAGGTVTKAVTLTVATGGGSAITHPRVWLTPASVAALSQRAAANDAAWAKLRTECDTLATYTVSPPDGATYVDRTINGEYQYLGYFDPAVKLGLCYQVAKSVDSNRAAQYGAKERQLVLALSDPVHHGNPTVDSGYGIRGYVPALALAYDWVYELLSPAERTAAYTEINRWIASYEATGFGRSYPQGNYFAGYYLAKVAGVLATEGENPQAATMWNDWLNRVHYGMVQPYYKQWLAGGGAPDGWNYGPLETLNMTRALLAVSTAKNLDLLRDATRPMTYPDGHARWMTHFTWPDRKTVNDRGLLYTNQPNRPPSNVSGEWATEFNGLLHALNGDNAGIMQQFTSEVRGFSANSANWVEFLYWNASAPKTDYTTGPLSYRTGGDGQAAMRSSWAADAVWGAFQAGPYTGYDSSLEEFPDQGSLAIQRGNIQFLVNADGALTTPTPGTQDATESIWTALFADVASTNRDGISKATRNFNTYHAVTPIGYWGEATKGPGSTNTTLSRFEEGGSYVLMRGAKLEDMFMTGTSPVIKWSRDVAYLRPQLFVVYDRTAVNSSNTDDWMAWHTVSTPGEQAGVAGTHRFDVLDTRAAFGGNLFRGRITTVLPAGHNVKIVDIADDAGAPQHKVYRLEIRRADTSATPATWLTVFDASGSAAAAGSAAPLTLASGAVRAGDVEGAVISGSGGNAAVLFSKSGNAVQGSVSIALPVAATTCLISDLSPSTGYSVTAAGSGATVVLTIAPGGSFTTTAQGTLSFSLNSAGAVVAR